MAWIEPLLFWRNSTILMEPTFAGAPLLSNVQLVNELAKTSLFLKSMSGEFGEKVQVMSEELLNGIILPLVLRWECMCTTRSAVGATGDASRPAAEAGAAGLATNTAAPVPRVANAANAAIRRRVTNTEILPSTCIPCICFPYLRSW
jgi:hypothetical protein